METYKSNYEGQDEEVDTQTKKIKNLTVGKTYVVTKFKKVEVKPKFIGQDPYSYVLTLDTTPEVEIWHTNSIKKFIEGNDSENRQFKFKVIDSPKYNICASDVQFL
jgi:hypothetical protein